MAGKLIIRGAPGSMPVGGVYDEHRFVDGAPSPNLAGLDRPEERMVRLSRVGAGVAVRTRITTSDATAGVAHAQVDPVGTRPEALLAPGDLVGRFDDSNLIQVSATRHTVDDGTPLDGCGCSATSRFTQARVTGCKRLRSGQPEQRQGG